MQSEWMEMIGAVVREYVRVRLSASPLLFGTGLSWPRSRIHYLDTKDLWLKRDDELSFTMSGPKFRKLSSIAAILAEHEHVISWGSSRSAFLLGLAQICREMGKTFEVFLLKASDYQDFGTDRLYANAFGVSGQDVSAVVQAHWITREKWSQVGAMAAEALSLSDKKVLLLPEGGASIESFAGSLSLSLDLVDQLHLIPHLDAVWIDSGSGYTAQTLIIGLGTLLENPPCIHVVLCAGDEAEFHEGLEKRFAEARDSLAITWKSAPFTCHRPPSAASYGATNAKVWETIARHHREYGLLLDPLYGAKMMMAYDEARSKSETSPSKKTTLMIHSGGGLNLFGFKKSF